MRTESSDHYQPLSKGGVGGEIVAESTPEALVIPTHRAVITTPRTYHRMSATNRTSGPDSDRGAWLEI